MGVQASSRKDGSGNLQAGASRTGRHARPASFPVDVLPDSYRNLGLEQLRAVERAIREAHIRARGTGAGSESVTTALARARTNLSEVREILQEARKELLMVHHEYDELTRRLASQSRYPVTATPAVPDTPGLDLCPDPGTAQTPAEYMEAFRRYRLWAGKPVLPRPGERHQEPARPALLLFHPPHRAHGQRPARPRAGPGGHHRPAAAADAQQQAFASAWRRLTMSQQNGAV